MGKNGKANIKLTTKGTTSIRMYGVMVRYKRSGVSCGTELPTSSLIVGEKTIGLLSLLQRG